MVRGEHSPTMSNEGFKLNVIGLENLRTFQVLRMLITLEDPEVVFLIETKLLLAQLERIRLKTYIVGCIGVDHVRL